MKARLSYGGRRRPALLPPRFQGSRWAKGRVEPNRSRSRPTAALLAGLQMGCEKATRAPRFLLLTGCGAVSGTKGECALRGVFPAGIEGSADQESAPEPLAGFSPVSWRGQAT